MKAMFRMKLLSLLTLLAFCANAFIPFFAVYSVAQAAAATSSRGADSRILICTSDGFKWVKADALGTDAPFDNHDDNGQHQNIECALCYVSAHITKQFLAVHDQHIAPPLLSLERISLPSTSVFYKEADVHIGYNGRAPPYKG